VITLSYEEKNQYIENIIYLANFIENYPEFFSLNVNGEDIIKLQSSELLKNGSYLSLDLSIEDDPNIQEKAVQLKRAQFYKAWIAIKEYSGHKKVTLNLDAEKTKKEPTKQPTSSFNKTPYFIVGGCGLTILAILAILHKCDKLSIIMEKISKFASTRLHSFA